MGTLRYGYVLSHNLSLVQLFRIQQQLVTSNGVLGKTLRVKYPFILEPRKGSEQGEQVAVREETEQAAGEVCSAEPAGLPGVHEAQRGQSSDVIT